MRPPLVPGDKGAALPECPTRKRTSDCSLFLLLSDSLLVLPFVCFLFFFFIYFLRMGNYWQAGRQFSSQWQIFFEGGNRFFFAQCENRISSRFSVYAIQC